MKNRLIRYGWHSIGHIAFLRFFIITKYSAMSKVFMSYRFKCWVIRLRIFLNRAIHKKYEAGPCLLDRAVFFRGLVDF